MRLSLHEAHARLGARFGEEQGWELPSAYSSAEQECRALRDAAGLSDQSFFSKISFSGPDRKKFLHGLLTNDVLGLKPMRGFPCCLLTPKGKLRADFILYDLGEELLALCRPPASRNLVEDLSKVMVLSQTRMEDASESRALFYLAGPKAVPLLESVFGQFARWEPYQAWPFEWQGTRVLLLSDPRLRPEGCRLLLPVERAAALWSVLIEAGKPWGLKPVGREALNILRVESGTPLFGVDMDEDTIPLEARLEEAISFTKGCYMGQETISRIRNLGHVNRILVGLKISGEKLPGPGAKVFGSGKEIGKVTSSVWSPGLQAVLALATVRAAESRPGGKLEVDEGGRRREAEVFSFSASSFPVP